jgi:hypothetical protein
LDGVVLGLGMSLFRVNRGEGDKNMMETATIRVICGLLAVLLLALIILRRRQRAQQ